MPSLGEISQHIQNSEFFKKNPKEKEKILKAYTEFVEIEANLRDKSARPDAAYRALLHSYEEKKIKLLNLAESAGLEGRELPGLAVYEQVMKNLKDYVRIMKWEEQGEITWNPMMKQIYLDELRNDFLGNQALMEAEQQLNSPFPTNIKQVLEILRKDESPSLSALEANYLEWAYANNQFSASKVFAEVKISGLGEFIQNINQETGGKLLNGAHIKVNKEQLSDINQKYLALIKELYEALDKDPKKSLDKALFQSKLFNPLLKSIQIFGGPAVDSGKFKENKFWLKAIETHFEQEGYQALLQNVRERSKASISSRSSISGFFNRFRSSSSIEGSIQPASPTVTRKSSSEESDLDNDALTRPRSGGHGIK